MRLLIIIAIILILFRIYFLFLEQKSLYYPEKEITGIPATLGIPFEQINFKTADNKILHGWYVPAKEAKITVLFCHGNAGNISDRLHRVKFFHELGVIFFIFDYRGYGKSGGRPSEKGLYKDALAAYDYLVSRNDLYKDKIVVYGESLGGAVAAELCLRRKARALILQSTFSSVAKVAQPIYPFLPVKLLIAQKYDTLAKIKNIHLPKLIAHGQQDEVINFQHGEMIFQAAAHPKQFLPFPGGHNDDLYVTSEAYKKELMDFFTKNSI
ncbi:MAG: alpha/beta hydrolase [Elusimicrobiota bacterium]